LRVPESLLTYHSRPGGRWGRILPGVYELTALPPNRRRPLLAALLWAGEDAVLSHRTAAGILRLDGVGAPTIELWARRVRVPTGLTVHRGRVGREDTATSGPLRHTSLLRTVIDLAGVLDEDTLELVVESALRRDRHLEPALAESGRKGAGALKRVLGRRPTGCPPTDSELETRYLQLIRRADVPAPIRQYPVHDEDGRTVGRLDLCWPEVGLWVELDGRIWHDRPQALLYDRHRQNDLATRLQWLPLRFTWDDVMKRPGSTARLTELAYQRRVQGRPNGLTS